MADTVIAPDLRELYDSAEGWPLSKRVRELIERVSKAEQENVALRVKVAKLEAPVRNLIEHQYVNGPDPRGCNYPVGKTICGYEKQEHVAARGREGE